jgi:two-component system KDP operon response regulator KdpE
MTDPPLTGKDRVGGGGEPVAPDGVTGSAGTGPSGVPDGADEPEPASRCRTSSSLSVWLLGPSRPVPSALTVAVAAVAVATAPITHATAITTIRLTLPLCPLRGRRVVNELLSFRAGCGRPGFRYRAGMPKVLVVEDEAAIRTAVIRALTDKGYAVAPAANAMTGLQLAVAERPDVVVLDLGLPDLDGREVLRMIRAVSQVPIIVATARGAEADIVGALEAGADDYVVKPFGAAQLDARIRAVLRRAGEQGAPPVTEVGGLRIDQRARRASLDGAELDLTPREFDLLNYLAGRAGTVVTKKELLVEVWQLPFGGADKTVDVHLSWLRRKLVETAQEPRYLHTVRRIGVRLDPPETQAL